MPACRECKGTGQVEKKVEIRTRCPDCDGSKVLPDGTPCKRCDQWGEVGTGKFKKEMELCRTCWGSGEVTEGSLTMWFLVRVVPATIGLLGGGGLLMWAAWSFLALPFVVAIISVIIFGVWGYLMYYFVSQMPNIGEISVTNWFLMRAVPATLASFGAGIPVIWASWVHLEHVLATVLIGLGIATIWAILMFYFISHLPE